MMLIATTLDTDSWNVESHLVIYAECCIIFFVMLSVIMLSVIMLSVIMLSDVMLDVVAPDENLPDYPRGQHWHQRRQKMCRNQQQKETKNNPTVFLFKLFYSCNFCRIIVSDPQVKQRCLFNQVYSMILSHKITRVFIWIDNRWERSGE